MVNLAEKNDEDLQKRLKEAQEILKANNPKALLRAYEAIYKDFPNDIRVLTSLGSILLNEQEFDRSIEILEKSLKLKSDQVLALTNLASAYVKKDRLDEALNKINTAIEINSKFADAYLVKATVLSRMQNLDESLEFINKGINLKPSNAGALNTKGVILQNMNRLDEALSSYDQAIRLSRDTSAAYFNKSYLKLLLGDYEIGWRLFEWRWKGLLKKAFRNFPRPLWLGNFDIKGKKILISQEQGLGDFIQYSRYIPLLKDLGAEIIVECNQPVMVLAANLGCEVVVIEKKKSLPNFDAYCPLMSLPLAFKTTLNNIPRSIPYIKVPDDKQLEIKNKLGLKTKFRVGLIWAGSKNKEIDLGFWRERSLSFEKLATLIDLPIEFHILQKEINQEDQDELKKYPSLIMHHLNDFMDTAAIMNEIDMVISVDTAGAHLAGALGKELWILIPSVCDYRWLLDRSDSPWYPTAKLYRQEKPGDWSLTIKKIKEDLRVRVI